MGTSPRLERKSLRQADREVLSNGAHGGDSYLGQLGSPHSALRLRPRQLSRREDRGKMAVGPDDRRLGLPPASPPAQAHRRTPRQEGLDCCQVSSARVACFLREPCQLMSSRSRPSLVSRTTPGQSLIVATAIRGPQGCLKTDCSVITHASPSTCRGCVQHETSVANLLVEACTVGWPTASKCEAASLEDRDCGGVGRPPTQQSSASRKVVRQSSDISFG